MNIIERLLRKEETPTRKRLKETWSMGMPMDILNDVLERKLPVGELASYLRDSDPVVRQNAALALGTIASQFPDHVVEATSELVPALANDDPFVRGRSAWALEYIAFKSIESVIPHTDAIVTLLGDTDDIARESAATILGEIGSKKPTLVRHTVPMLINALDDPSQSVCRKAATALGFIGGRDPAAVKNAIPHLTAMLDDTDSRLRDNAVCALKNVGRADPSFIGDVRNRLVMMSCTDESASTREFLIMWIINQGEKYPELLRDDVEQIARLLDDNDNDVASRAADVLDRIGGWCPDSINAFSSTLLSALSNKNSPAPMRAAAAQALGFAASGGDTAAIEGLTAALRDTEEDVDVRAGVMLGLGRIGMDGNPTIGKLVPEITASLTSKEDLLRKSAAMALGIIGEAKPSSVSGSITAIAARLEENEISVKKAAAWSIGRIGSSDPVVVRSAIPKLLKALEDDDSDVRADVAETLGLIGAKDPACVACTIKALNAIFNNDEVSYVRGKADDALKAMNWTGTPPEELTSPLPEPDQRFDDIL